MVLLLVLGAMSVRLEAHNPLYHNGPGKVMKAEPQAMSAEEQQFTYYFYAAQRAMDAAEYDDALALSSFAYRLKPTDPAINYFLGILYRGLRQEDKSLSHLSRRDNSCIRGRATLVRSRRMPGLWPPHRHRVVRAGRI